MKDNDSDETTIIMVMVNVVQSCQMLVKLTTVKNKGELIAGGGQLAQLTYMKQRRSQKDATWRSCGPIQRKHVEV